MLHVFILCYFKPHNTMHFLVVMSHLICIHTSKSLTNKFHVAMCLFSNRSQMTSKFCMAYKVIAECVTDVIESINHKLILGSCVSLYTDVNLQLITPCPYHPHTLSKHFEFNKVRTCTGICM